VYPHLSALIGASIGASQCVSATVEVHRQLLASIGAYLFIGAFIGASIGARQRLWASIGV
jgi:hypothetical protein